MKSYQENDQHVALVVQRRDEKKKDERKQMQLSSRLGKTGLKII
jgi:hypothetical protein